MIYRDLWLDKLLKNFYNYNIFLYFSQYNKNKSPALVLAGIIAPLF